MTSPVSHTAHIRTSIGAHAEVLRGIVATLDPHEVLASQAPALWAEFDRVERLAAAANAAETPGNDHVQSAADSANPPGSRSASKRHRRRRRRRADSPTYLALLRIDFAALQRGHTEDDEICEIAGIGPIPVKRARQLLSDAVIKLIATKGEQVANVTHYGRKPTTAQRMALLWTQPTCSVAGCDHSIVQIDHLDDWHKTHRTRLETSTISRRDPRRASAPTTIASRPTTGGASSREPANEPWSHPTTPATPTTSHKPAPPQPPDRKPAATTHAGHTTRVRRPQMLLENQTPRRTAKGPAKVTRRRPNRRNSPLRARRRRLGDDQ